MQWPDYGGKEDVQSYGKKQHGVAGERKADRFWLYFRILPDSWGKVPLFEFFIWE